jgi:hypothetical protein
VSGMRRDIVLDDVVSQAFDMLEDRICNERDADNLLTLLVRISTLLDLLEEQNTNMQSRLIQ